MNSAKLSKSPRLQAVFNVLLDGAEHTTRDLVRKSGRLAINSIAAELRENGIGIDCQRRGNRWYYKLEKA